MLGLQHITFMLISFIFILIVAFKFKNNNKRQINFFIKFFTIVMLLFDPIYWFWEIYNFGKINIATSLPLYYCSLCWICMPFIAFTKPNSKVNRTALSYICTLNILMGIFGLVFNVYLNRYPLFSFVPIRSLIYHVFMLLIPAVLWISGYYRPKKSDLKLFFIPVLLLAIPCIITNILYGWDYCYIGGGIGTPIAIFSKILPKPIFIICMYAFLYSAGVMLFFVPYFTYAKIKRNKESLEKVY